MEMGRVAPTTADSFLVHTGSQSTGVIEHSFSGGALCDETGQPRAGTLQYVCDKLSLVWQLGGAVKAMVARVAEIGKCQYRLVVQ